MAIRLFSMREIIKRGEARGKPAGRPEHDSYEGVTEAEENRRKIYAPAGGMKPNSQSGRFGNIGCLWSFGALYDLEFDRVTFLQRSETIADNCRVVNENIGPVVSANESVSFRVVKPLHGSSQFVSPFDGDSWGGKKRRHEHEIARSVSKGNWESRKETEKFFRLYGFRPKIDLRDADDSNNRLGCGESYRKKVR
jgi:hypothetical protein